MNNILPFHYEIRVKLLAFDKNNNVRNESFRKVFNNEKLLKNRINAFEEFNEYLSFLKQLNRLEKNMKGNYLIVQPSFISEILNRGEREKDFIEFENKFEQFKEEISIYLIINDIAIARNIIDAFEYEGSIENEFEIHKVASYSFEEQDIIDNLDMNELPLFEHFKINTLNLKETVYHYGLDYADSGEEENGAIRTILKTPHIWNNLDDYHREYRTSEQNQEEEINTRLDFLKIIEKGENNQIEFKPSLLYNFKSGLGGIGVKYIIAKTICGFLNSNGGVLFIGVTDKGEIQGLEYDYSLFKGKNEKDKLLLELDSLLVYFFDLSIKPLINSSIENINGKDIFVIAVNESQKPIFLKNKKNEQVEKEFYIRMNASTRQVIDIEEIVEYILNNQLKKPSR